MGHANIGTLGSLTEVLWEAAYSSDQYQLFLQSLLMSYTLKIFGIYFILWIWEQLYDVISRYIMFNDQISKFQCWGEGL